MIMHTFSRQRIQSLWFIQGDGCDPLRDIDANLAQPWHGFEVVLRDETIELQVHFGVARRDPDRRFAGIAGHFHYRSTTKT